MSLNPPLGGLVAVAHRELVRELELNLMASGSRVRFSQYLALRSLHRDGPSSSGALARSIGLDAGATTRLLDDLEGRALVSRNRMAHDRRTTLVGITPKGTGLFQQLYAINEDVLERAQAGLSGADREHLRTLLSALITNLRRHQDDPSFATA